jgi:chromate transporter
VTDAPAPIAETPRPPGTPGEVFRAFAKLGVTSFGGPIAHLGYFRDELVTRRRWVDDRGYADLVALCQFLPGPASSQVGFALGLLRAGPAGALAAWLAFTLPSAILMVAFAAAAGMFGGVGSGILTGLKIVAVAIVAQAVWGMARSLTPDARRAGIAVVAAVVALVAAGSLGQVAAIVLGALAGLWLCRAETTGDAVALPLRISRRAGLIALGLFVALLIGLPVAAALLSSPALDVADAFFRAGALVFGGGHVVLPLLEAEVVTGGWVSPEEFLAGYGAAQAMPGPLFTFAAYLGALAAPGAAGLAYAALALVAIFVPGMLLLIGTLPFWNALRTRPAARAAMRGANAAVVGILAAALYDPVFVTAIVDSATFALALVCFVLLVAWRTPPWVVVLVGAAGGVGLAAL